MVWVPCPYVLARTVPLNNTNRRRRNRCYDTNGKPVLLLMMYRFREDVSILRGAEQGLLEGMKMSQRNVACDGCCNVSPPHLRNQPI